MADDHSPEYYRKKFIPLIYLVATILIVGTIVTFAADKLGVFGSFTQAIVFALTVAFIKAGAVIYIFMHLKWDIKFKTISLTLACTLIFFIGMMWLTVGSEVDSVKPGHADNTWKHGEEATPAPAPEKQ